MGSVEQASRTLKRLAPAGSRVVLGVSGGPDSQALLHLVGRLGKRLAWDSVCAVGVDHGLRPEARDELSLAEELAECFSIPFLMRQVEVSRTGNLLAAARSARYAALRQVAKKCGATRIAVAHTATDQVETFLLNAMRGAGLRGIGAIRPRRGPLIRPLLSVPRAEILDYLGKHGVPFAHDPSNRDQRRSRARLRQRVLPELSGLCPNLEAQVERLTRLARSDERYLLRIARTELAAQKGPLGSLQIADFLSRPQAITGRILRLWLRSARITASASNISKLRAEMARPRGGLSLGGRQLRVEQGHLWVVDEEPFACALPLPGIAHLPHLSLHIESQVLPAVLGETDPSLWTFRGAPTVAFDADRLHLDLEIRTFRSGDRVQPFGLNGQVKIGDMFTNHKIPRPLRRKWPLVVMAGEGGDVVWVVGIRRGSAAPVTAETQRIAVLTVSGKLPWHVG